MNPISLLTKGRTIGGLKERPGRYKLVGGGVFPKFSGFKCPVPTTTHPKAQNDQTALFEQPKPKPPTEQRKEKAKIPFAKVPAIAKAASVSGNKVEPLAPVKASPAQRQPAKPGFWSRLAEIVTGWMQNLNPWRKATPFVIPTFQTELALEKIKVIRNDLSEDDLEVVMIEKKAGNKAQKPVQRENVELEKATANP
jgi:hypothetical protein